MIFEITQEAKDRAKLNLAKSLLNKVRASIPEHQRYRIKDFDEVIGIIIRLHALI